MTYTDETPMKFGKYTGTKLGNIPASYLLYLRRDIKNLEIGLKNYIDDNMDVLKKEMEGK